MSLSPDNVLPSVRIDALLRSIYGEIVGKRTAAQVEELINEKRVGPGVAARCNYLAVSPPSGTAELSERDVLLITYADQVRDKGVAPLQTLASFLEQQLVDVVSGVHILPFYPWSSDDGFSVKDYFTVEPSYGSWRDIARLRERFDLMFDAVFNHLSAQSGWFQKFLRDEPKFRDFFVVVEGRPDLSQVVRPRALPLLTRFQSAAGPKQVWTTFSADQVDLNARNPRVLLALLDAVLCYVGHGARFIRLDAIAYFWKEFGTTCIHLPQTHQVIQVMRAVLDEFSPQVQLITETNVPHADNISYFGDGTTEAQLVYNFALPPLVLHALLRGDARHLTRWAATLKAPSYHTTFFNFLASHDGIGLNPARGILPPTEIEFLVERCEAHGGFISYKHNADGSQSPYELNIVYFDALNAPTSGDPAEMQVDRFIAAQAIMLSLAGLPGIYFHSLFGSRNDRAAALESRINRRINRQKLTLTELEAELQDATSLRHRVFGRYRELLKARRNNAVFNPQAEQQVLTADPRVFAVLRTATRDGEWVLCLHNVTNEHVTLNLKVTVVAPAKVCFGMLSQQSHNVSADGTIGVTLRPYEVNWLVPGPHEIRERS